MSRFKEDQKFIRQATKISIDPKGVLTFHHIENERAIKHSPVSGNELNTTIYPNFADVVTFRLMFMEGIN
jgi:hypothetical protein